MNRMNAYNFIGQTVFARWRDGYYYPAVVDSVGDYDVKVSYLDGDIGVVKVRHIVEFEEGMRILRLQSNWQNRGIFFRGNIRGTNPTIMHYNDGDIEEIELKQLRGARPGEPTLSKKIACAIVAVASIGAAIFGVSRFI